MLEANSENFYHYNNRLKNYTRSNRKAMKKAEACMWKYILSKSQMMGYPFKRQRAVLNYIPDFMCQALKFGH